MLVIKHPKVCIGFTHGHGTAGPQIVHEMDGSFILFRNGVTVAIGGRETS